MGHTFPRFSTGTIMLYNGPEKDAYSFFPQNKCDDVPEERMIGLAFRLEAGVCLGCL